MKIENRCTHVPLTHVTDDRLNAHMGKMNSDGWELMSVAVEAVGIEEKFIMFWVKRTKEANETQPISAST